MGALDLARAFGFHEVELPEPPGFGARIRLVQLDELLRSRTIPTDLRRRVVEMATSDDEKPAENPESLDVMADAMAWQVAGMVKALRTGPDAEWEPVSLTPEVFSELPPRTQAALRDIAEGRKTPAMVTALVRVMRGEMTEDEAAAVIREERPKLLASWDSFRGNGRGAGHRPDGQAVASEPVELPAEPRPHRRARAG